MRKRNEYPASITQDVQFPFRFSELLTGPEHRIPLLLILLISLALYYQTLSFGFVWDDLTIALMKNERLINPSLSNILYFWSHPENGMYIPLTYTAWSIFELFNHAFLGTAFYPGTYHLANFLVHTLNTLLVLTILYRLVKSKAVATASAILFLIHPLQVEVVAWVFELRTLLATCFGFSSFYLYLVFLHKSQGVANSGKYLFPWGSLVFFVLAILSKPAAVIIPFFFITVSSLMYGHTLISAIKKVWPWLLLAIVITMITLVEQPQKQLAFHKEYSFWISPLIWMDSINFYLIKILFPISLSSSYARTNDYLLQQWWFSVAWLIPILIGLVLIRYYRHHKILLLGVVFFLIGFLPVSALIPFWFQYWSNVADRYMYISMLGVAIVFSAVYIHSYSTLSRFVMICFLVFCFFWSVAIQIPVWRSEHTLWDHAIQVKQNNPRALYNRGITYTYYGMWDKAIIDINKSIALDRQRERKSDPSTVVNLAGPDDYIKNLTWSINTLPDYTTYLLRAYAFFEKDNLKFAIHDLERALQFNPKFIKKSLPDGVAYTSLTKPEKNLILLNLAATEFGPSIPELYIYVALTRQHLGEDEHAINRDLDKAIMSGVKPDTFHQDKLKKLFSS